MERLFIVRLDRAHAALSCSSGGEFEKGEKRSERGGSVMEKKEREMERIGKRESDAKRKERQV